MAILLKLLCSPTFCKYFHLLFVPLIFAVQTLCDARLNKVEYQNSLENGVKLSPIQSEKLLRFLFTRNIALQLNFLHSGVSQCPIFAVTSSQSRPTTLFQISSSTRNNSLDLHFALDKFTKIVSIAAPLSQEKFHRALLIIDGTTLGVYVDCKQLLRIIDSDLVGFGTSITNFSDLETVLGDDARIGFSCGHIREFSVEMAGNVLEARCPDLEVVLDNNVLAFLLPKASPLDVATTSPSSTSTEPLLKDIYRTDARSRAGENPSIPHQMIQAQTTTSSVAFHDRVDYIQDELDKWGKVLHRFDARIRRIELFQRGCTLDKKLLPFGEKRQFFVNCTECQCSSQSELHCGPIGCKKLDCPHPIHIPGRCCPECGRKCLYNGQFHESGEEFWPKQCVRCLCDNGNMQCQFRQSPYCPLLNCPPQQQVTPPNQCCPVCKHPDFCDPPTTGRIPCHQHAICESEEYSAICYCKEGFFGNGTLCYDIDECNWDEEAKIALNGCRAGTYCINLPGSFKCDCLPGFQRLDERTCIDLIRN